MSKKKNTVKPILSELVTTNQMRKHVEDGLTDVQIAEIYGVSLNTVFRFRSARGIRKQSVRSVRNVEEYFRMKELKLTDENVAFIWGISRRVLTEWKKREEIDGISLQKVDSTFDGKPIFEVIARKPKKRI